MRPLIFSAAAIALISASAATAQQPRNGEERAEAIISQPLKDIGIMSDKAPELLVAASKAPYSLAGLRNCRDYLRAIAELTEVLGPDLDVVDEDGRPVVGKLAEAGGKAVVTSLIPLRGLVREVTGAAASDRALARAVASGGARRAFLKGYAKGRGCKV